MTVALMVAAVCGIALTLGLLERHTDIGEYVAYFLEIGRAHV